jgi:quercetin dioxygenase-like cupin family protein
VASDPSPPPNATLGDRVRAERARLQMTLKDVQLRSGLSATHVSEIERGRACPTIQALARIARALHRDASYFLEASPLPELCVVRAADRAPHAPDDVRVLPLTDGVAGARLRVVEIHLPPGLRGRLDFEPHHGEECGYVLRGKVEVRVGEEKRIAQAGDGFHFLSRRPHGFRNPGADPAVLVVVANHRTLVG